MCLGGLNRSTRSNSRRILVENKAGIRSRIREIVRGFHVYEYTKRAVHSLGEHPKLWGKFFYPILVQV